MRKTALITGGSRGIGLGIAKSLLASGYEVAINGVREEGKVAAVMDELRSSGGKVEYIRGDIGNDEGRYQIISEVKLKLGTLNVLVNNAGVAPKERKDILEINEEDYDYLMDINLKGTFFLTQELSKLMIDARKNDLSALFTVVNITSISAEVASVNRGEYCISKAGLSMMSKLLAVRLGDVGIPVYEVRPGVIATDMTAGVKEKYEQKIADGLLVEKRMGQPGDIGKIVASLASGGLPYSTGQVLTPDGGLMIQRL